ncbi:MAG TPA: hypothetical protein VGE07_25340, partial [Herpetosiphonaceae bacterium]
RAIGRRTAKRVGAQPAPGRQRLAMIPAALAALLFVGAFITANLRPGLQTPPPDLTAEPAAGQSGDWLYMVCSPADIRDSMPVSSLLAAPLAGGGPNYLLGERSDAILSPDGAVLYGLSSSGPGAYDAAAGELLALGAYEAATGKLLWEVNLRDVLESTLDGPPRLAVSPDGRTLAVASMQSDLKGSGGPRYWIQTIDTVTRQRSTTAPGRVSLDPVPGGVMINPISPNTGQSAMPPALTFTPATPGVTIEFSSTLTDQTSTYAYGQPRESAQAYQPLGVGALFFSADSRYLYSVAPDAIYVYDLKQGDPVRTLGGPGLDGAAALAPDGRTLYATSVNLTESNKMLTLNVVDLQTGAWRALPLGVLDDGYNPGRLLALSADGRRLVLGVRVRESADQPWTTMLKVLDVDQDLAEVWRIRTGVLLRPGALAIDSAGTTAYAVVIGAMNGGTNDLLASYDLLTGEILPPREYDRTNITRLLIAPAPAGAPSAPTPTAAPAPTAAPPAEQPTQGALPPLARVSGTAFLLHRAVGAPAASSRLTAFDVSIAVPRFSVAGGIDAILSADGRWVHIVGEREIRSISAATGEERWSAPISNVIQYKDTGPPAMALAPDGRTIYVMSFDVTKTYWIQIVDAETGAIRPETIPLGVLDGAPHMGVAGDGETLYAWTGGELRFIDLKTRQADGELSFDFGSDILPARDGTRLYVIGHRFPALEISELDLASREIVRTLHVPAVNGRSTVYGQIAAEGDGRLVLGILNTETQRQQLISIDPDHPELAALTEPTGSGIELRRHLQAVAADGRSLYLADRNRNNPNQDIDSLVRYDMLNGAGPFERWPFPHDQLMRVLIAPAEPATEQEPAPAPPPTALPTIPATATPRP